MACSRTRSGNVPTYGSVQVRLSMTNGDSVVRALNVEQTKIAQNLQHATNADADLFIPLSKCSIGWLISTADSVIRRVVASDTAITTVNVAVLCKTDGPYLNHPRQTFLLHGTLETKRGIDVVRVTYVNFDGRFCRYFTPERYAQLDDDYIKEYLKPEAKRARLSPVVVEQPLAADPYADMTTDEDCPLPVKQEPVDVPTVENAPAAWLCPLMTDHASICTHPEYITMRSEVLQILLIWRAAYQLWNLNVGGCILVRRRCPDFRLASVRQLFEPHSNAVHQLLEEVGELQRLFFAEYGTQLNMRRSCEWHSSGGPMPMPTTATDLQHVIDGILTLTVVRKVTHVGVGVAAVPSCVCGATFMVFCGVRNATAPLPRGFLIAGGGYILECLHRAMSNSEAVLMDQFGNYTTEQGGPMHWHGTTCGIPRRAGVLLQAPATSSSVCIEP